MGKARAHRSSATRRHAEQQGDVGPLGAGAGASLHRETESGDGGEEDPPAPASTGRSAGSKTALALAEATYRGEPTCRGGGRGATHYCSISPCHSSPPPPPPPQQRASAATGEDLVRMGAESSKLSRAPEGTPARGLERALEHQPCEPIWRRRGPHWSASRCRELLIERHEPGAKGCLWPDAVSPGGRMDG